MVYPKETAKNYTFGRMIFPDENNGTKNGDPTIVGIQLAANQKRPPEIMCFNGKVPKLSTFPTALLRYSNEASIKPEENCKIPSLTKTKLIKTMLI